MSWQLVACLHIYRDTKRNECTSTTPTPTPTPQTKRKKIKIFDDNYHCFVNVFVDYFDLYPNMNSTYTGKQTVTHTMFVYSKMNSRRIHIHRDEQQRAFINFLFGISSAVFFGCYCWFLLTIKYSKSKFYAHTQHSK